VRAPPFVQGGGRRLRPPLRPAGGGPGGTTTDQEAPDPDTLCFALVTQKTSLYLQAATRVDRDCLVRGFQLRLEGLRG
jgi:hypothetical protein